MAYTPPVGTVDLDLTGSDTPPIGIVDLDLGADEPPQRTATLAGETLSPTGAIATRAFDPLPYLPPVGAVHLDLTGDEAAHVGTVDLVLGGSGLPSDHTALLAGETLAPTGLIPLQVSPIVSSILAGETLAPTGMIEIMVGRTASLSGETLAPVGAVALQKGPEQVMAGETLAPTGMIVTRAFEPARYIPPIGVVDLDLCDPVTWTSTVNLNMGGSGLPADHVVLMAGETLAPTGQVVTRAFGPIAYIPPVGVVDLNLCDPITWTSTVNLNLGGGGLPADHVALLDGETLAPTGAIAGLAPHQALLVGETQAPTGQVAILQSYPVVINGETLGPIGSIQADYDPNLLSEVVCATRGDWSPASLLVLAVQDAFRATPFLRLDLDATWQDAALESVPQRAEWRDSPVLMDGKRPAWTEALSQVAGPITGWQDSPALQQERRAHWQEAEAMGMAQVVSHRARLTLWTQEAVATWREGALLTHAVIAGHQDGRLWIAAEIEVWQDAGYPGNAPNPGPPLPIPIPWPWGTSLNLRCPLPTSPGRIHLNLGRSPCILVAEREVPYRRSYMTVNTASLVRWPDLTPLPVTSMTIETDFDSWCWALTATLAGPDAWALVQPNPLACEVQATINDQVWRFLLDVPSQSRSFNSDRVTLKGRSRSAWLHDPYTPSRNFSQSQARDMTQLAALAVENTGWSVDWRLDDWLVPAGRYNSWNTPIGALIRLANTTDDGLYTHPVNQIITLHKRWPVASWLLDGETMDILIPEAAILSLTQSPVYSQPLNGVYISGISHGALALVKIAGTDGALQPAEPITDELLCDEAGVAARQRGLNVLSDAGAGWEMDAETLFNPTATPAFPLVPPGQIVSIAGLKGISRSCRITAQRSGNALSVRQSIGLERREVEA